HFLMSFTPPSSSLLYTLSLHDALPIFPASVVRRATTPSEARESTTRARVPRRGRARRGEPARPTGARRAGRPAPRRRARRELRRSEEHTSELQSRSDLVCRLLLEKKKK